MLWVQVTQQVTQQVNASNFCVEPALTNASDPYSGV